MNAFHRPNIKMMLSNVNLIKVCVCMMDFLCNCIPMSECVYFVDFSVHSLPFFCVYMYVKDSEREH